MKIRFLCLFWAAILFTGSIVAQQPEAHEKVLKLMGSRFEIVAVSADAALAWRGINAAIAEIERIEQLISSWDAASQTSEINRNAGIRPVKVDRELFELIRRSKKVSQLTDGIFDISFASVDKIWKFDGSMTHLPTAAEMAASVSKINYENIILDDAASTVFLRNSGMKIGFGAIGKGYAANKAKAVMLELGIENGVVNAGGDLNAWGVRANGEPWEIGITDPKDKTKTIGWLQISNTAVVTSGNYEKFVEFDGKRYSHIIHPKTGMPVSGTKSVTIVCPDAELADALATSVFILGEADGVALIDRLAGIECLLINDNDQIFTSKNLHLNYTKTASTPH